ncbi:outer membrane beta-barrel protein [Paraflavisolibacter sp. H34]|uniref:outer membrane beta-barrel protein n=1 Tax=Huijunlia imazamoxiresistens TaxID=3127457 RepID=UPI003017A880
MVGALLAIYADAQQAILKGSVQDTLEKKPLPSAVVTLVHKKDSTLYRFTRTGQQGAFTLPQVAPGKYVLLVSYPKFADYTDELEITAGGEKNLGRIALTLKAQLLQEVVVRSGQAIRIKGDTTEFAADSFAVREGATVEDLLKKLPGLSVNSKGEITAQGKNVDKVLVDGEEFFGDDPTVATQNLSARAVDKVQVYDTKSEQQQLSGMTTGNEGKTVNIKLKESAKRGAFGKQALSTDFHNYLDIRSMYNKFVGNKKISVYGTQSNVNAGSLNRQDRQKLGFENDYEYDEVSGYYSTIGGGDEFGNVSGLPEAYSAGGLFGNKWNAGKHNVNGSYAYNRLGATNERSSLTRNVLPNKGLQVTSSTSGSEGLRQQHSANGKYEWKIDSLASVKLVTTGAYKWSNTFDSTLTFTRNELDALVNKNDQHGTSEANQLRIDNQLVYKQLFKKKNRQLLTTLRHGLIDDEGQQHQYALMTFYRDGSPRDSVVDQQRHNEGQSQTLSAKVTYNEPLTAKWNLVTDYSFSQNQSSSDRATYNRSANGKFEKLDSLYSNNFDLTANANHGTAILRFVDKKFRFGFGSGLSTVALKLNNLSQHTRTNYRFTNYTPQANFSFMPKQQTSLSLNYRGTTRQPSIDQLQPIRNNNDLLNVYIGNPDLKVGFNHNLSTFFSKYKVLTGEGIWVNAGYNLTNNAITNYATYDEKSGKRTTTPVNVDGNDNWYFYGQWGRSGNGRKWNYSVQLEGNGGHTISFINAQKGVNTYSNGTISGSIGYEKEEKLYLSLRPKIGRNDARFSLRPGEDNAYLTYGGQAVVNITLPWKLQVNTDLNADLRQLTLGADRRVNRYLWNGTIKRKVLKKDAGQIVLVANDILNQNRGFYQFINGTNTSEGRSSQIARYFLLRFEWNFNQMPGAK